ncbi:hypothetical protein ACQEV4_30535 [Streptomyces shenzhenensis]|uniref:hypothetical protein n=1 Tax=Streptomyces shenzhenensis TaxID=943815 RepID=UPI003D8CDBBD
MTVTTTVRRAARAMDGVDMDNPAGPGPHPVPAPTVARNVTLPPARRAARLDVPRAIAAE